MAWICSAHQQVPLQALEHPAGAASLPACCSCGMRRGSRAPPPLPPTRCCSPPASGASRPRPLWELGRAVHLALPPPREQVQQLLQWQGQRQAMSQTLGFACGSRPSRLMACWVRWGGWMLLPCCCLASASAAALCRLPCAEACKLCSRQPCSTPAVPRVGLAYPAIVAYYSA